MRVRLRFAKVGKIRFTSHRDLARIWERALRRAEVPLVYSQGFSPRPKLHFGLALPTGAESWAEFLDADVVEGGPGPDGLPTLLTAALPVGLDVTAAAPVEAGSESLQQAVVCCDWRIEVVGAGGSDLSDAVERLLAAPEVPLARERKGQVTTDDVRPYVERLEVAGPTTAGVELIARLGTQPRGLRPAELVAALGGARPAAGPELTPGRIIRTHQWMQRDGARQEPLPTATSAPHAEARAS
jgi:radical SAM-linked protein